MARPPKEDEDKRAERLNLRLSPTERAALDERAAQMGLTTSAFVRMMALKRELPPRRVIQTVDPSVVAAINRCGAQLNMIARALHVQQGYVPADLADGLARFNEIADRLQDFDDAA